jgi:hypothetical protein
METSPPVFEVNVERTASQSTEPMRFDASADPKARHRRHANSLGEVRALLDINQR